MVFPKRQPHGFALISWAYNGGGGRGKFPPPEDLVHSRHSKISATFEIRKKSYWPYLCVLRPVDEIYRVSQKSCPLKK